MAAKALLLDRDGVVNVEKNYLYKPSEFEFVDGIVELCFHFQSLGYMIIIVTNQSGIARGYYTTQQFLELTDFMEDEFAKFGVKIAKTYFCPHHPEITGKCRCRKPEPGMILDAAQEFEIDLPSSVMIGDKERDIEAAINAGVGASYLFDETKSVTTSKATKIVHSLDAIWK